MGDNAPKVVEAERFVVRDPGGKIIAALECSGGTARLTFRDRWGKVRAALGVDDGGDPGLDLYDRDETPRATLSFLEDGAAGVILRDGEGKRRLALGVDRDGMAALHLHGPDGLHCAELGADRSGTPRLVFFEPQAAVLPEDRTCGVRALLAFLPDGTPSFALARKEGIIWGRPWLRAGTTASVPRFWELGEPDRFLHPGVYFEIHVEQEEEENDALRPEEQET